MESDFRKGTIVNVLRFLSDRQALVFFSLSSAFNDLTINLHAIGKFPTTENSYFFYSSISIVREIAPLVVEIRKSNFLDHFTSHSKELFSALHAELSAFDNTSIAKQTLKSIRDLTFHYNLNKSSDPEKVAAVLG